MSRICVIGAGIGGLTSALSLVRKSASCQVTLLEQSASKVALLDQIPPYQHVGLWTPALCVLTELGILSKIQSGMSFVGESCYRSYRSGKVLAAPSIRLDDGFFNTSRSSSNNNLSPRCPPKLAFVAERALRSLLLDSCGNEERINMNFGTQVRVSSRSDHCHNDVRIHLDTEEAHFFSQFDLIVAADGKRSTLRRLLSHTKYSSCDTLLTPRGYFVVRGFTPAINGKRIANSVSFQTWGPGRRFAVVPVSSGNMWYAAISDTFIDMIHNTVESHNLHKDMLSQLKYLYEGWHDPIDSLLYNAQWCGGHESAEAFQAPVQGGLSTIINNTTTVKQCPIAFIGDAAHTLDPILAQGAGVAVEDASHLTAALMEINVLCDNDVNSNDVLHAVAKYDQGRSSRLQRLHTVSNIAQFFGHMESNVACDCRDILMSLTPSYLKSAVMNGMIQFALSGRTNIGTLP